MQRTVRLVVALLAALLVVPALGTSPAGGAGVPDTPVPLSPLPGSTTTGNPEFSWAPVKGAVRYQVQISNTSDFSSIPIYLSSLVENTTVTPTADLPLGTIYWRVLAFDALNVPGSFPVPAWSFTKVAADGPVLTAPADAATVDLAAGPVSLAWNPVPGARRYIVEVDDDAAFTDPIAFSTFTDVPAYALPQPPTPLGATSYWRIRAVFPNLAYSVDSATRSFTTVWSAVPVLTFPPDAAAPPIEEVVLEWQPLVGAVSYDLEVTQHFADESDPCWLKYNGSLGAFAPDHVVVALSVKTTRFSPPTTFDACALPYTWRVRAKNVRNDASDWSTVRSFTRAWPADPGAGQTPTPSWSTSTTIDLLAPADGAQVTEPTFTWTPMRLASSYEVQFSQDPTFAVFGSCTTDHPWLTLNASTLGDACGFYPLPSPAFTYYWRVRPRDLTPAYVSLGAFTAPRSFSYVPNPVNVTGPPHQTVTDRPVLTWDVPADHIGRYEVAVTEVGGGTTKFTTYDNALVPPGLKTNKIYAWTVRTVDAKGYAGPTPGASRAFTVVAPTTTVAPGDPIPLDPPVTTGAGGIHAPILTWTPVAGAARYQVWMRPVGAGSWTVIDPTPAITMAGYAHPGDDLAAGTYEYEVHALDGADTELSVSGIGSFAIAAVAAATTTAPAHCAPGDPCAALSETPVLTWDRVPGATHYQVVLATDPGFASPLGTYTTNFTTLAPGRSLADNAPGGAYWWYVRACAGAQCAPAADTVGGAAPPLAAFAKHAPAVVLLSPAAGGSIAAQTTLAWQDYLRTNQELTVPGTAEARTYRVRVATNPDLSGEIDNAVVDQTTYTPIFERYPVGTLYWTVNAIDGTGNELPAAPVRSFTKTAAPLDLLAPAAGATVTGVPAFSWAPQEFSRLYEIEIYAHPDQPLDVANRVVQNANIGQPAFTPITFLPEGTYGWRVRRYDADANPGPWTADANTGLRLFTVTRTPATLTSPTGGAWVPDDGAVLRWSPAVFGAQYRVELSTDPTFATLEVDPAPVTAMTSWATVTALAAGTHHWRVVALDGDGNPLTTSAVGSFTTSHQGGAFHAVTPYRALDSRGDIGGFNGYLGSGETKTLLVADGLALPASATAVVMNVTVTNGTLPSFLSLFPTGEANPGTASLLFAPSQTVPNLVTVRLGQGGTNSENQGRVNFFNQQGAVHVIADVVGYYDSGRDPDGSLFNGMTPARALDSRGATGGWGSTPLGPNTSRDLTIAGPGSVSGVPATATGVVMNVTATGGTLPSFLAAYPAGTANPGTASLLFAGGQTVPNLVVVGLGSGGAAAGKVTFYNQQGSVHVVADVVGYFDPTSGDRFHPITPVRALDSRSGPGNVGLLGPWGTNTTRPLLVAGSPTSGVPVEGTGIVANATVTGSTSASFLTLFPGLTANPGTANLLFGPGQTIPNAVYVKVGTDKKVQIYNQQGQVHVIMDVAGYFAAH